MKALTPALLLLLISGCISIRTELQPPNAAVKPVLEGSDCTPIILGIGIGTNTYANALHDGQPHGSYQSLTPSQTIKSIHSARLDEGAFLMFGSRCLEVTGEP
jgi:hypothetical protein